jgi:hypothetical protein
MGSTTGLAGGSLAIDTSPSAAAPQSHAASASASVTLSSSTVSPSSDRVEISSVPSTSELELLPSPVPFRVVVANAVLDLRDVAARSTDPQEAAYLIDLANRFQTLAEASGSSTPTDTTNSSASPV